MHISNYLRTLPSLLAAAMVTLVVAACADNDLEQNTNNKNEGDVVAFAVNDVQQNAIEANTLNAPANGSTRAASPDVAMNNDLTAADLETQVYTPTGDGAGDLTVVETVIEGINPQKAHPATRGTVTKKATLGQFSSMGFRGSSASGISKKPNFFHNVKTNANGSLTEEQKWSGAEPYANFFAVHPLPTESNGIVLSGADYSGTPYVDFTVQSSVADQQDLITAATGTVHYSTPGTAPTAPLMFRHALTAIKFVAGYNMRPGRMITKIEIRGAMSKGRYTLPTDGNGTDGKWSDTSEPATFSIDVSSKQLNTGEIAKGTVLAGEGDNNTFFMIPQDTKANGVMLVAKFDNGQTMGINLQGEWKAGTTRTLTVTDDGAWETVFNGSEDVTLEYNQLETPQLGITSYTQSNKKDAKNKYPLPAAWEVDGYDSDGDGTFSMAEEPSWLLNFPKKGDGGTVAETFTATTTKDYTDLDDKQAELKNATARGTWEKPHDLSRHDIYGNTTSLNTANCYVVTAPGVYRIPLVYGNAYKNGSSNRSSIVNPGTHGQTNVLDRFVHSRGEAINVTATDFKVYIGDNGWTGDRDAQGNDYERTLKPQNVEVVWADEAGLVKNLRLAPASEGRQSNFLEFEVPRENIKPGNAVIKVTETFTFNSGVTETFNLWSWHIWVTNPEALATTDVKNAQGVTNKFAAEALGWKWGTYKVTDYAEDRVVKVKVKQLVANNGVNKELVFTIRQKAIDVRQGQGTTYQWGRKDAFPASGNTGLAEGSIKVVDLAGAKLPMDMAINNPDVFYINTKATSGGGNTYYNLWNMGDLTPASADKVTKTIYDPSPAGFTVPHYQAYTGFTATGDNESSGTFTKAKQSDHGLKFQTGIDDNTVFMSFNKPRSNGTGASNYTYPMSDVVKQEAAFYWTASAATNMNAKMFRFTNSAIYITPANNRQGGYNILPMVEK